MIYNIETTDFFSKESYKERNLYYKIFSGYMFNELVDGYYERVANFKKLLLGQKGEICNGDSGSIDSLIKEAGELELVTFDFHLAQILKDVDRGESSDVLLHFKNLVISIECKYLSNPDYSKDITSVQSRISLLEQKSAIQVLLIKEKIWKNSVGQNKPNSFVQLFKNRNCSLPCVVVFWEDIISSIYDLRVKGYLTKQLERKSKSKKSLLEDENRRFPKQNL